MVGYKGVIFYVVFAYSLVGHEIDIYLKPLVDELKELWEEGVDIYDAYNKEHFQMRAILLWTIHDYPGFGNVSGWRTKGYHSCYTCNDQPYSEALEVKLDSLTIELIYLWNIVGDIVGCIMVYRRNERDL